MNKSLVEITYSRKGLLEILVDGHTLDSTPIQSKPIFSWFIPSPNKKWMGLVYEVEKVLDNTEITPTFAFYGPPEYERIFRKCLIEYGIEMPEAPLANEIAEERFKEGELADIEGNEKEALNFYLAAAELGHMEGQYRAGVYLGNGYNHEDKTPTDTDKYQALKLFEQSALQGHLCAAFCAGIAFYMGYGVTENPELAFNWFYKAAVRGHAEAQSIIGEFYYTGYGVSKDIPEAIKWYRKSAQQSFPSSEYNMSFFYQTGEGVPYDEAQFLYWLQRAAEHEHEVAQYVLASLYGSGDCVLQDHEKEMELLKKSAVHGYDEAEYTLAKAYATGNGVEENQVEATKWFRKAADQSHAKAPASLNMA